MFPQSYYTSFAAHLFDNCRALNGHSIIALILATFLSFMAQAMPENIENYEVLQGGLTDIKNGAYIEGSLRKGGVQPDYFIDLNSEPLKTLLQSAQSIGQEKLSYWNLWQNFWSRNLPCIKSAVNHGAVSSLTFIGLHLGF